MRSEPPFRAEPPAPRVPPHYPALERDPLPRPVCEVDGASGSASTSIPATSDRTGVTGKIAEPLTAADGPWFADNYCFQFQAGTDLYGCHPNWWNGAWTQWKTRVSQIFVAPYSGDWVNVRMQYSSITKFTDVVFNGQFYGAWYHSASSGGEYLLRTHRWDVLQATNDGFHFSYGYSWSCVTVTLCNWWPL